jgi:alpha-glucosidase (family GH31 glycosyl hydrolase)
LAGNVLRKYLFLQLSLLPYLRPGRAVTHLPGCFLQGDALLIAPVSAEDVVDVQLPPGVWTELGGACVQGRLRCMRGFNEMPVLVRENTLLPIGVSDRSADHDDADRLTLHWYQPRGQAECILADGTRYTARECSGRISVATETDKPFHVIVHQNGETLLVQ